MKNNVEGYDDVATAKEITYLSRIEVEEGEALTLKYTADDLDAAWWDGYSIGAKDSSQEYWDRGYAEAIDDMHDEIWNDAFQSGYQAATKDKKN
jgi:hypothetical protein